jgi:hypothetical protein
MKNKNKFSRKILGREFWQLLFKKEQSFKGCKK